MSRSLLVFFFCFSCQSKTANPENNKTLMAKVTQTPGAAQVKIEPKVLVSPRKPQELQAGILGTAGVQKCLNMEAPGAVIEGHITPAGGLEGLSLVRADKAFELCLMPALKAINLGKGRAGAFKLQLLPAASDPGLKKFE